MLIKHETILLLSYFFHICQILRLHDKNSINLSIKIITRQNFKIICQTIKLHDKKYNYLSINKFYMTKIHFLSKFMYMTNSAFICQINTLFGK